MKAYATGGGDAFDRDAAVDKIARNYLRFIEVYERAPAPAVRLPGMRSLINRALVWLRLREQPPPDIGVREPEAAPAVVVRRSDLARAGRPVTRARIADTRA